MPEVKAFLAPLALQTDNLTYERSYTQAEKQPMKPIYNELVV